MRRSITQGAGEAMSPPRNPEYTLVSARSTGAPTGGPACLASRIGKSDLRGWSGFLCLYGDFEELRQARLQGILGRISCPVCRAIPSITSSVCSEHQVGLHKAKGSSLNAINHAATALLINRKWPGVPLIPVLVCVQLVEFFWVIFNLVGLEVTTTEAQVASLSDIHLSHMPYSHSIASTVVVAAVVWFVTSKVLNKPLWAFALAAAISSHIVLDLVTHVQDIQLAPGLASPKLGTGLYGIPILALVLETLYGVWCWRVFRGSMALLVVILLFNVGAASFYIPQLPGPEAFLAGHPKVFAAIIGLHIVAGLAAIGVFARSHWQLTARKERFSTAVDK